MSYALVVLNGKHPGTSVVLDASASVVTIGRHSSNDLQLDDDRASRTHARVQHRGDRWHLEDSGSLNGTYLNSQVVQQTVLEAGDLIRIGERLIVFVEADQQAGVTEIPTSVFRATTSAGTPQNLDARDELVEQSVSESVSRVVRDSTVLCRLANLLQQHNDAEILIRSAIDALVGGIKADSVSIWLVAADGRLRCAGEHGAKADDHLLASLAVERQKAILIDSPSKSNDVTEENTVGYSIGVPIPGPNTCRGAIECHRERGRGSFFQGDLDFSVVVAHQAGMALENLEHREQLELANAELRRRLANQTRLVGSSQAMQQVFDQIARVGPATSNVLILGESGTGKEIVARSIHDLSRHSAGPYVTVNCAAFTESLLESELFGHEQGAFTGADRRHIGQFERAHRGTMFLDEVGEMSLACQARLLRVLEGHSFQRLGGQDLISVDVRVIAATHRDLPELITEKQFREDLYYRLRVIDIRTPALRDRGEDAIELASMFIDVFRSQMGRGPRQLSSDAIAAIRAYSWPGNVRELKNAVERAVVMGRGQEVAASDLGLPVDLPVGRSDDSMSLKEAERRHIQHVLAQVGGNKTKACKILGIGRATLYSRLHEATAEFENA